MARASPVEARVREKGLLRMSSTIWAPTSDSGETQRFRAWSLAVPFVVPLAAAAIQRTVWSIIPPSPQLFFYPAVFWVAWKRGLASGLVATGVSCFSIALWFLPPLGTLWIASVEDALDLAIFAAVCAFGCFVIHRARQARLAAEQANRAKDVIVSLVSHDLQNPLDVISFSVAELSRALGGAPSSVVPAEAVARIRRAAERASGLVKNVLLASIVDDGVKLRLEREDLADVLSEAIDVVRDVADNGDVTLASQTSIAAPSRCDHTLLVQGFVNVIGNAIKFSPRGGTVEVTLRDGGNEWTVEIIDDGPGIPEELREKIFERRYSAPSRHAGTGLGLFLARTVIEGHHGTIWVGAGERGGARFVVELPKAS